MKECIAVYVAIGWICGCIVMARYDPDRQKPYGASDIFWTMVCMMTTWPVLAPYFLVREIE